MIIVIIIVIIVIKSCGNNLDVTHPLQYKD